MTPHSSQRDTYRPHSWHCFDLVSLWNFSASIVRTVERLKYKLVYLFFFLEGRNWSGTARSWANSDAVRCISTPNTANRNRQCKSAITDRVGWLLRGLIYTPTQRSGMLSQRSGMLSVVTLEKPLYQKIEKFNKLKLQRGRLRLKTKAKAKTKTIYTKYSAAGNWTQVI